MYVEIELGYRAVVPVRQVTKSALLAMTPYERAYIGIHLGKVLNEYVMNKRGEQKERADQFNRAAQREELALLNNE